MERKAYKRLLEWKASAYRKPLLMLGARQVGKTWLMREFGTKEYANIAYINCDTEPLTRELFKADYDINRLLLGFQAITGQSIKPDSTLIILDEIQQAPRALHSLKYFREDAPNYHVMAAGSLLGVTLGHGESFPVGQVDIMHVHPMDFEEFLQGIGQGQMCEMLRAKDHTLANAFAPRLTDLLRQYYFVGGMPEVVGAYANHKDLNEVKTLQTQIVDAYRRDVSKHASKTEAIRIGQVLASLPAQLAKENKRFIYGVARPGARASDFEMAIQWLVDAGLVTKVVSLKKVAVPLSFYADPSAFKLFFVDVGLLSCLAGIDAATIMLDTDAAAEFNGMIAEQYVAQQLTAAGILLFYWRNERTPAELDFVIQIANQAVPVEVKSGANVRGKSISQFIKNNPGGLGIRFSLRPYERQQNLTNIPLYCLPFWTSDT